MSLNRIIMAVLPGILIFKCILNIFKYIYKKKLEKKDVQVQVDYVLPFPPESI